jgi:hypothetical protein
MTLRAAVTLAVFGLSATALAEDPRQLVKLPAPAEETLRQEMRDNLVALNEIITLTVAGKVKEAGVVAREEARHLDDGPARRQAARRPPRPAHAARDARGGSAGAAGRDRVRWRRCHGESGEDARAAPEPQRGVHQLPPRLPRALSGINPQRVEGLCLAQAPGYPRPTR